MGCWGMRLELRYFLGSPSKAKRSFHLFKHSNVASPVKDLYQVMSAPVLHSSKPRLLTIVHHLKHHPFTW